MDKGAKRRETDAIGKPVNITKLKMVRRPYTSEELEKAKQAHRERVKGE